MSNPLEILGNTGVAGSRVDTGILDARVTARLDIPNDGLIILTTIRAMVGHLPVVRVIPIVARRRMAPRHVALLRGLGVVGSRVRGRGIRGSAMDVAGAGVGCNGNGAQHANRFNLARFGTGPFGILDSSFAGGRDVVVSTASLGHGHAHSTGQIGGGLATGGGGAPATVSGRSVVLGRNATGNHHTRECRIIVGVEAIFFNLLTALFLGSLVRLTLAPEPERGQNNQSYGSNGHDNGNGNLAAR